MRDVQAAGGIGMRVDEDKVKGQTAVLFFRRDDVDPGAAEKAAEVRRLLGLPAGQEKFVLTYSPVRGGEGELAVSSRSMLQVMAAFASYMDVPEAHVRDGSVVAAQAGTVPAERAEGVRIRSGTEKPADAFAAVRYRNHWYWIDNGEPHGEARPHGRHVLLHARGHGRERAPAAHHHPGAVAGRTGPPGGRAEGARLPGEQEGQLQPQAPTLGAVVGRLGPVLSRHRELEDLWSDLEQLARRRSKEPPLFVFPVVGGFRVRANRRMRLGGVAEEGLQEWWH